MKRDFYRIAPAGLAYLKRAAKVMRLDWRPLAARPTDPMVEFILKAHRDGLEPAIAAAGWLAKR